MSSVIPFERYSDVPILTDLDTLLTGGESWPIIGDLLTAADCRQVVARFTSLSRYGDCFEKARIAQDCLRWADFMLVAGEMRVVSADGAGCYGFDFNPPVECHCWLTDQKGRVIDFALPGVIETGLKTCDQVGPILVGRVPAVLAGITPSWLRYGVKVRLAR